MLESVGEPQGVGVSRCTAEWNSGKNEAWAIGGTPKH